MDDQINDGAKTSAAENTRAKEGSDIATQTAASTGTAEKANAPGERLSATLPGDDVLAKVDALHAKHFVGTELAAHTSLWNMVMAFKEEVKKLLGEAKA